jgi:hypothetical protein
MTHGPNSSSISSIAGALTCLAIAFGSYSLLHVHASAADWDGGGLPASIAKQRPSASVPANLPGSDEAGCAVLRSITLYQKVRPGTYVEVRPSDTLSPGQSDSCGSPAPNPATEQAIAPLYRTNDLSNSSTRGTSSPKADTPHPRWLGRDDARPPFLRED